MASKMLMHSQHGDRGYCAGEKECGSLYSFWKEACVWPVVAAIVFQRRLSYNTAITGLPLQTQICKMDLWYQWQLSAEISMTCSPT